MKIAKIVRDNNVRKLAMDIMMGVLKAKSYVINKMARVIE